MIRTRFAPSPTGYLHIGGARTALFCWAYAKKHGGTFILRIEDTDRERSTEESVQAILQAMEWLGLDYEGPYFQMERLERYREVAEQLIAQGRAYHCYASARSSTPCASSSARAARSRATTGAGGRSTRRPPGLKPPPGAQPVVRFRNPDEGEVAFERPRERPDHGLQRRARRPRDPARGRHPDLQLRRGRGRHRHEHHATSSAATTTSTTRRARSTSTARSGRSLPEFAHVPMILGHDGERLSKRHGAVSVMQYRDDGYLPEALVNYLARLGWSHGDEEMFTREQLVEWFDLAHISRSPARFDPEKLAWLNGQHHEAGRRRAARAAGGAVSGGGRLRHEQGPADLTRVVALLKERVSTLKELAGAAVYFYRPLDAHEDLKKQHYLAEVKPALDELAARFSTIEWNKGAINDAIKSVIASHKLKMPKIAMPLRVMVSGSAQTPSIDATLELIGREEVLARMGRELPRFPG